MLLQYDSSPYLTLNVQSHNQLVNKLYITNFVVADGVSQVAIPNIYYQFPVDYDIQLEPNFTVRIPVDQELISAIDIAYNNSTLSSRTVWGFVYNDIAVSSRPEVSIHFPDESFEGSSGYFDSLRLYCGMFSGYGGYEFNMSMECLKSAINYSDVINFDITIRDPTA